MKLNYQIRGEGEPVFLIHGLFGSLENLGMVAKPLSEHFKVISVDVRNHGASFHADTMTYKEMANDIIELIAYLDIDSAIFLGHSMGGKIAMQLALSFPEKVTKLIVADIAPVSYPAHHQHIINGLQSLDFNQITTRKAADQALAHYVEPQGVRQFLLRNLALEGEQLQFKCNLDGIAKNYPEIMKAFDPSLSYQGETLFIKGGNSDYITNEHRNIITQHFPQSKAKIIASAGHWLHAEKPIAFNKIVKDFITD